MLVKIAYDLAAVGRTISSGMSAARNGLESLGLGIANQVGKVSPALELKLRTPVGHLAQSVAGKPSTQAAKSFLNAKTKPAFAPKG